MLAVIVLSVSVLIQLVAAALAVRLIRITGWRTAWTLIAAALSLMALRRLITLLGIFFGQPKPPLDPPAEIVALTISILMVVGIAKIVPSVVASRKVADALKESENRLRAILQTEPECVKLVDAKGTLLEMNPAGLAMIEADVPGDVIGKNICPIVIEEHRQAFLDLLQRVSRGESGTLDFEIVGLKGGRHWLSTHATPLRDRTGRITAVLGVTRNITHQRQAEAERMLLETQLLQSQKMEALGTLAGGIAHDFNNLLTIIQGNAELAAADVAPTSPQHRKLTEIQTAGARASDLVSRILTFSRPKEAVWRPVNMSATVGDALTLLRSMLPATIDVRTELAVDPPSVLADTSQLHQVVINLGTNAAHAMGDHGGLLDVRVEAVTVHADLARASADLREGEYVRLSVRDSGCGMDQTTLARIFEPFFTTKAPGHGTGLGLSVVFGIVKNHGGAITVESRPGRGTVFHLYFPECQNVVGDVVPAPERDVRGHGEHILIVDDQESLVKLVAELLERLGYRVTGFSEPTNALHAFQSDPDAFDVVITDLSMPGMSGRELARNVLTIRPDSPVIVISGYASDEASLLRLGVRDVILKPNLIKELGARLRQIVRDDGRGRNHASTFTADAPNP